MIRPIPDPYDNASVLYGLIRIQQKRAYYADIISPCVFAQPLHPVFTDHLRMIAALVKDALYAGRRHFPLVLHGNYDGDQQTCRQSKPCIKNKRIGAVLRMGPQPVFSVKMFV